MAAGGEVFVAGQFLVTWDDVTLGIMEGDSGCPTIEQQNHAEPINNSDAYGKVTIDAIHQGLDYFAQFTCLEYRAGSIAAFNPFAALGQFGIIGRLYYDLSKFLVLTSIAGTPAENSPASISAGAAILAPGYNTRYLLGPTLRKVPIRQILLPTTISGGDIGAFEET